MLFLIDADSLIYKAGCSNERRFYLVTEGDNVVSEFQYKKDAEEFVNGDPTLDIEFHKEAGPVAHSISNIENMLMKIVEHRRCKDWRLFIGEGKNFRYEIDPDYKGHRSANAKPIHEKAIKQHLKRHWNAEVCTDIEADDRVSIIAMQEPLRSVIVTIDKDLDNTPGWHYNYDKKEAYFVDLETANLNFYRQLLSGDPTDNIKGVKGIGKGRAADILQHPLTEDRLCAIVWDIYKDKGYDWDYFVRQGQLLWMMREEGVRWQPPLKNGLHTLEESL